jgi:ribosomal protein S18 acetylase RimI-like enzyme
MGTSVTIAAASGDDTEQILKLQYLCYQSEAQIHGDYRIEPLTQTLADLRAELAAGCVLVARLGEEVIGSVRARVDAEGTASISKLFVHPRMHRHGLGSRLLTRLEERLAAEYAVTRYRLITGHRSENNLRLYRKHGYARVGTTQDAGERVAMAIMEKETVPSPLAASA